MKATDLRILYVLIVVSVSMAVCACASKRVNLLKDGTIKLERVPSRGYYISSVYVNQNGDELVITGRVKRRSRAGSGSGHVDIAVVSADGDVLEQISTLYKPRIILTRKMHTRESYFEARLPTIPPMGSKVRVAYHRDSKPDSKTFSCDENMAVPAVGI
ncbi:MAG: hypothetical protein JRJ15_15185 [Deltaproteobacteria bacterium]|nr:hypothetical protein [Deltaproteobacteria bacterium]